MLRLLRRLLGWDSNTGPFDFDCLEPPARPRSSTASVLGEKRSGPTPQGQARAKVVAAGAAQPRTQTRPAPPPPPAGKPSAGQILDNPELSLNGPQDEGFDPYNTGAFNRSSSWEQISKHRGNR